MRREIPIWFFAGIMLLAYGIVILLAGLWELSHPLVNPPTLSRLHAPIWWGALLAAAGLLYTVKYWPRHPGHKSTPEK